MPRNDAWLPNRLNGQGAMPIGLITVTAKSRTAVNAAVWRSTKIPKLGRLAAGNSVESVSMRKRSGLKRPDQTNRFGDPCGIAHDLLPRSGLERQQMQLAVFAPQ